MNKIDYLKTEINYIKNKKIKKDLEYLITLIPDYFFEVAASSTGKYHPSYALNEGGLLRHTKAAVKIAHELLYNNQTMGKYYTEDEKDLMLVSLVMHDTFKHGKTKSQYTIFEHPLVISKIIEENKDKLSFTKEQLKILTSCIETHMGEWTTDYQGNNILEKPSNKFQNFVHMCDFLASRKFLEVPFENNEIIK